jgi:hypothetical protein
MENLIIAYLGVIISIYKKLCAEMRPKISKNSINLFEQLFLTHLTYFLCKISVVEYSYRSFS